MSTFLLSSLVLLSVCLTQEIIWNDPLNSTNGAYINWTIGGDQLILDSTQVNNGNNNPAQCPNEIYCFRIGRNTEITYIFSTINYYNITFTYSISASHLESDECNIYYSVNNGTDWQRIEKFTSNSATTINKHVMLSSNASNNTNIGIKLAQINKDTGGTADYCYFSDISVKGVSTSPTANPSRSPDPTLATTDECILFTNYFTVHSGKFQDICGDVILNGTNINHEKLPISYLYDHINPIDNTFNIENGEFLNLSSGAISFDANNWAILFEGYNTKQVWTDLTINMLLGSNGTNSNCQIRYQKNNGNMNIMVHSTGFDVVQVLPFDILKIHTLLLYYNHSILSIFQNNQFIASISGTFQCEFGHIGDLWYLYPAQIAIKNLMFAWSVNLDDIRNFSPQTNNPTTTYPTTTYPTTSLPTHTPITSEPTNKPTTKDEMVQQSTIVSTLSKHDLPGALEKNDNSLLIIIVSIGGFIILCIAVFFAMIWYTYKKRATISDKIQLKEIGSSSPNPGNGTVQHTIHKVQSVEIEDDMCTDNGFEISDNVQTMEMVHTNHGNDGGNDSDILPSIHQTIGMMDQNQNNTMMKNNDPEISVSDDIDQNVETLGRNEFEVVGNDAELLVSGVTMEGC